MDASIIAAAASPASEVYENQRFYVGFGWGAPLKVLDWPAWTDAKGEPVILETAPQEGPEWELVMGPHTDHEGWIYGTAFARLRLPRVGGRACKRGTDATRTRLWVRRGAAGQAGLAARDVLSLEAGRQRMRRQHPSRRSATKAHAVAFREAWSALLDVLKEAVRRRQVPDLALLDPAAMLTIMSQHGKMLQQQQVQQATNRLVTQQHVQANMDALQLPAAPASRNCSSQRAATKSLPINQATLQELLCCVKHARAAYGHVMLQGHLSSIQRFAAMQVQAPYFDVIGGASFEAHNQALQELLGITEDDILLSEWSSAVFRPCHFLTVSRQHRCIVVAIRGSLQWGDICTDVTAAAVNLELGGVSGKVHEGMLSAAAFVHSNIMEVLQEVAHIHPGWPLLVTGHSLGAGVASVLAVLLHQPGAIPAGLGPVRCYPIAPPSVMTSELAERASEFTTSLVLGADVVPRLSLHSVEKLLLEIKRNSWVGRVVSSWTSAMSSQRLPTSAAAAAAAAETTSMLPSLSATESHHSAAPGLTSVLTSDSAVMQSDSAVLQSAQQLAQDAVHMLQHGAPVGQPMETEFCDDRTGGIASHTIFPERNAPNRVNTSVPGSRISAINAASTYNGAAATNSRSVDQSTCDIHNVDRSKLPSGNIDQSSIAGRRVDRPTSVAQQPAQQPAHPVSSMQRPSSIIAANITASHYTHSAGDTDRHVSGTSSPGASDSSDDALFSGDEVDEYEDQDGDMDFDEWIHLSDKEWLLQSLGQVTEGKPHTGESSRPKATSHKPNYPDPHYEPNHPGSQQAPHSMDVQRQGHVPGTLHPDSSGASSFTSGMDADAHTLARHQDVEMSRHQDVDMSSHQDVEMSTRLFGGWSSFFDSRRLSMWGAEQSSPQRSFGPPTSAKSQASALSAPTTQSRGNSHTTDTGQNHTSSSRIIITQSTGESNTASHSSISSYEIQNASYVDTRRGSQAGIPNAGHIDRPSRDCSGLQAASVTATVPRDVHPVADATAMRASSTSTSVTRAGRESSSIPLPGPAEVAADKSASKARRDGGGSWSWVAAYPSGKQALHPKSKSITSQRNASLPTGEQATREKQADACVGAGGASASTGTAASAVAGGTSAGGITAGDSAADGGAGAGAATNTAAAPATAAATGSGAATAATTGSSAATAAAAIAGSTAAASRGREAGRTSGQSTHPHPSGTALGYPVISYTHPPHVSPSIPTPFSCSTLHPTCHPRPIHPTSSTDVSSLDASASASSSPQQPNPATSQAAAVPPDATPTPTNTLPLFPPGTILWLLPGSLRPGPTTSTQTTTAGVGSATASGQTTAAGAQSATASSQTFTSGSQPTPCSSHMTAASAQTSMPHPQQQASMPAAAASAPLSTHHPHSTSIAAQTGSSSSFLTPSWFRLSSTPSASISAQSTTAPPAPLAANHASSSSSTSCMAHPVVLDPSRSDSLTIPMGAHVSSHDTLSSRSVQPLSAHTSIQPTQKPISDVRPMLYPTPAYHTEQHSLSSSVDVHNPSYPSQPGTQLVPAGQSGLLPHQPVMLPSQSGQHQVSSKSAASQHVDVPHQPVVLSSQPSAAPSQQAQVPHQRAITPSQPVVTSRGSSFMHVHGLMVLAAQRMQSKARQFTGQQTTGNAESTVTAASSENVSSSIEQANITSTMQSGSPSTEQPTTMSRPQQAIIASTADTIAPSNAHTITSNIVQQASPWHSHPAQSSTNDAERLMSASNHATASTAFGGEYTAGQKSMDASMDTSTKAVGAGCSSTGDGIAAGSSLLGNSTSSNVLYGSTASSASKGVTSSRMVGSATDSSLLEGVKDNNALESVTDSSMLVGATNSGISESSTHSTEVSTVGDGVSRGKISTSGTGRTTGTSFASNGVVDAVFVQDNASCTITGTAQEGEVVHAHNAGCKHATLEDITNKPDEFRTVESGVIANVASGMNVNVDTGTRNSSSFEGGISTVTAIPVTGSSSEISEMKPTQVMVPVGSGAHSFPLDRVPSDSLPSHPLPSNHLPSGPLSSTPLPFNQFPSLPSHSLPSSMAPQQAPSHPAPPSFTQPCSLLPDSISPASLPMTGGARHAASSLPVIASHSVPTPYSLSSPSSNQTSQETPHDSAHVAPANSQIIAQETIPPRGTVWAVPVTPAPSEMPIQCVEQTYTPDLATPAVLAPTPLASHPHTLSPNPPHSTSHAAATSDATSQAMHQREASGSTVHKPYVSSLSEPTHTNPIPTTTSTSPSMVNGGPLMMNRDALMMNRGPVMMNRSALMTNKGPSTTSRDHLMTNRSSITTSGHAPQVQPTPPIVSQISVTPVPTQSLPPPPPTTPLSTDSPLSSAAKLAGLFSSKLQQQQQQMTEQLQRLKTNLGGMLLPAAPPPPPCLVVADRMCFEDLYVTSGGLTDHLPDAYLEALMKAMQDLGVNSS